MINQSGNITRSVTPQFRSPPLDAAKFGSREVKDQGSCCHRDGLTEKWRSLQAWFPRTPRNPRKFYNTALRKYSEKIPVSTVFFARTITANERKIPHVVSGP